MTSLNGHKRRFPCQWRRTALAFLCLRLSCMDAFLNPVAVSRPSVLRYSSSSRIFSSVVDREEMTDVKEADTDSADNFRMSGNLLDNADGIMKRTQPSSDPSKIAEKIGALVFGSVSEASRRMFLTSILAAGTLVAVSAASHAASDNSALLALSNSRLSYKPSPVNKRSGVTVFDAEQAGYNVRFVTYLSRFLLCFDADCQRWWYSRASDLPRRATTSEVDAIRLQQFGAFSASVEVGLQEYQGRGGPAKLMDSLMRRYCPDFDKLTKARERNGLPALSESAAAKQIREIKEARRQIALLFGLMETYQPVEDITKLLAAIDNGSISRVEVVDGGSGYAPGYGPPAVRFPPPAAGEDYTTATGRASLRPSGKILRVDVINRGFGYSKAPTVTISPPAGMSENSNFAAATAKAYIFRDGVNKGRIERIQIQDTGKGYTKDEIIRVKLSPPDAIQPADGGVTATAAAILEYEVDSITIVNNGTGYAVEKPIAVFVDPPPLTARVNLNDPMIARVVALDQPLPQTSIPTKEMRKKMPGPNDPDSVANRVQQQASKGGGGGCIGRACYDREVVAYAYPRAEVDSYNQFRSNDDATTVQKVEAAIEKRKISALTAGRESSEGPPVVQTFGIGPSSSSQLLSLLPDGIGLEYDRILKRYRLSVGDPSLVDWTKTATSTKPLDPEFGPRGRSPIEREMELGVSTYLRFFGSGAICCSAVHLALTPIDVVKTKMQTNPVKYTNVGSAFNTILKEGGAGSFFTGWAPTFLGFFAWGGIAYTLTELLRRYLADYAGDQAGSLEVPIILAASGLASFLGCFVICPFEAVRIRSVAQPDYGDNMVSVFNRIIKEEGVVSLLSALPAFMAKEVPFAMAKFTVFDLSTEYMYNAFPAASEDLQLSLLISLAGGTLGGIVAAFVSNPADATVSEMKKAQSDLGPIEAAQALWEKGGLGALFNGLGLRMFFYSLVVSLQFFVYDAVRFALGIGADDLKLYLDVLGGALSESGGPV